MSKLSNQKLKLLYLLKILNEKTDTYHTLTVPEMILELKKYNISAERKSIYDDIESLKAFGIDILCKKSKTYDYYNYELLHDRRNIRNIKPITNKEYYVCGFTALLDAIGITINKVG
ncbi:MAG: hypothetical protein WBJ13_09950 [Sedimentibacter sp.]